ncbi:PhzF family phenazine biosynthesis protein [Alkalimonas collagenimarina]|uniref:PhzF family phenazine biosynthesis protein n=1 Tax=Alkalimonas collagenimarina TaxID=400390 RepID=A0ABT9GXF1_9GAMM|nr:PhzF family phenazine biosynthesis protein [Alkalimonas collagenimarina]MDP4535360.1 PhzF family phenazine biosynthesis protein [Alkalimonas collagenimarina]
MNASIYDVFCNNAADKPASGNPCAVVVLEHWLSDAELLAMAQQLAQPVTSFVVSNTDGHFVRWFTVVAEINLCGHGSLAAGAALLSRFQRNEVLLQSSHGNVVITEQTGCYQIRLPTWQAQPCSITPFLKALGLAPVDVFSTRDLVVVLGSGQAVRDFQPDLALIEQMNDFHALILTAQSAAGEYVLRYFTPKSGIAEDVATGSAQCSLAPYWFDKLGKTSLQAHQLSSAGGFFKIEKESAEAILIRALVKERV